MPSFLQSVLDSLDAREGKREYAKIARESGVPYATLRSLRSRSHINPRVDTLQKLSDYFAANARPGRKS